MENSKIESQHIDRKKLNIVVITYGVIVALVNYVGFVLANSSGMPVANTPDYAGWTRFMHENPLYTTLFGMVAFAVPALLIVVYRYVMVKKTDARLINLPFVYSAIGTLGWVLSFLMEYFFLCIARRRYGIQISEILFTSFLNILQEAICIFTLAFLTLNFIHRKHVLPMLYPEGNLSKFSISLKPSVRFIVIVFYLSICIFPVFFVTSTLFAVIRNNGVTVNRMVFIVLALVMAFSGVILWTFCNFFTAPLKKLKSGIQNLRHGDYEKKVDIVSSDDFGELADAFNEMSAELKEKNQKILAIQDSIIKGMAVMVESRDNSTGGHISRTSDCVRVFVDKISETEDGKELTPEFCKAVIKAAPMHDLGKIAVDDVVLRKPGKFTDEEYEIMKTHSAEGARIVESVLAESDDEDFKRIAVNVAHYHHEKWNGTGYPEKISGEEIPLEARIMALADVFDALVSKRCYKESFSYDKAFSIIEESLGSHFDPVLGAAFIKCRPELEALYNGYSALMA